MSAELVINDRELGAVGVDSLADHLGALVPVARSEIWLTHSSGSSLCILKSGDVAMLMLLRGEGDAGLVSRSSDQSQEGSCEFTLSNGQVDEYPSTWTVPFQEARRAAEHFWSSGTPAPFVTWHAAV